MTQGARVLKTAFLLQPVRRGTLESMKVCVLFCLFFLTVANTQETEGTKLPAAPRQNQDAS